MSQAWRENCMGRSKLAVGSAAALGAAVILASCASLAPTLAPSIIPNATTTSTAAPISTSTASPTASAPPTPEQATATPLAPPMAHLSPGEALGVDRIWMIDALHGWAIGGATQESADHILRTSDGGEGWRDVTPPEPRPEQGQEKVAVAEFLDADTGWVIFAYRQFHIIPSAVVWATQDGGSTWTPSAPLPVGDLFEFFSPSNLTFIDPQHGWVMVHAGAGMMHDYMSLYRTVDGGRTWVQVVEAGGDQIQICPKTGMAFADAAQGWITRDCGGVIDGAFVDVTTDGGSSWDSVDLPPPEDQPHLFDSGAAACTPGSPRLFSPEAGLLALRCVTGASTADVHTYLYATSNSGSSWQVRPYPGGVLDVITPQSILALSRDISFTTNSGATWTHVKAVNWDGQFSFVDISTGWAVARNEGQVALVNSVDGGRTWQEIQPIITP